MGGDGGTIPKRKDRVKTKSRSELKFGRNIDGERDPLERWKMCALSGYPIRRPVMAGQWGHILSKEGVIEYLLKKRANSSESVREYSSPLCDVLHKMSDIIELKLRDNAALTNNNIPSEEKYKMGDFVCPITGLETNGKYKFVFSWKCGCVISERALKECEDEPQVKVKKCLVCEKPYESSDIVLINPVTQKELEENQMKYMARKMGPHHRDKLVARQYDTGSSDLSPSSHISAEKSDHSRCSEETSVGSTPHKSSNSSRHRSPNSSRNHQ